MLINNKVIDYGKEPFAVDLERLTKFNTTFRRALWTGTNLQLTVMSIPVGEDIGLERHDDVDQFIYIISGIGITQMGNSQDNLNFSKNVYEDFGVFVPAKKWHNIKNIGKTPLKLFSVYAPPEHPFGTIEINKQDSQY